MAVEKPYCNGTWTRARFNSFIASALRKATMKWAPKTLCAKNAKEKAKKIIMKAGPKKYPEYFANNGNYKPGQFLCEECKTIQKVTIPRPEWSNSNKTKINNCAVDHIRPIVDPAVGFTTWDSWIHNCFCEIENLACICAECHHIKCVGEKEIETSRKKKEKDNK